MIRRLLRRARARRTRNLTAEQHADLDAAVRRHPAGRARDPDMSRRQAGTAGTATAGTVEAPATSAVTLTTCETTR